MNQTGFEVRGRVALITGGNRGIGRALVDALVAAGAMRVYATTRTILPYASRVVVPIKLDVTDPAAVAAAAAECGHVDLLVNNAGVALRQALLATDEPDAIEREMAVNFFGTLRMCRAFAPVLRRNGGGAIVNILSIMARVPAPRIGSYAASKAAGLSLTQSIRGELADQGTHVLAVMPGYVDTDMVRHLPPTTPKLPAPLLAQSVIAALRAGDEEIYPGDQATEIERALRDDPRATARQLWTA